MGSNAIRYTVALALIGVFGSTTPAEARSATTPKSDLIRIRASACSPSESAPRGSIEGLSDESFATAVSLPSGPSNERRSYLVAKAFGQSADRDSEICYEVSVNGSGAGKLVRLANDARMGLSLFEFPRSLRTRPWEIPGELVFAYEVDVLGIASAYATMGSQRHFFPASAKIGELHPSAPVGTRLFQTAGAPVVSSYGKLDGVMSDQTLVVLPGQPSRVFRDRDLGLLRTTPFQYERLVVLNPTLAEWIREVTRAGWVSMLVPTSSTTRTETSAQTTWKFDQQVSLTETCYKTGGVIAGENFPVGGRGGVEPVGIGGLEDVLSDCRFSLSTSKDSFRPDGRFTSKIRDGLEKEGSARLFLAYRQRGTSFEIRSLPNAHALAQLVDEGGWEFLTEENVPAEERLRPLIDSASKALDATVEFFRKHGGNPFTMRKAFFFATILKTNDHGRVQVDHLKALLAEIDNALPLSLTGTTSRAPRERTVFAQDKSALLRAFQALSSEREKLQ